MTQNYDVFSKRKGQSAIEYLMTYGWMLLVVAIVGGAIFATVQGQGNSTTTGFQTADVRVNDFALTSGGDLAFQLSNYKDSEITVTNVSVGGSYEEDSLNIGVGSSRTYTLEDDDTNKVNVGQAGGFNDYEMNITYNVTDGINNQVASGTLTSDLDIN